MENHNTHCTNCGENMDVNATFCVKCGVSKGKTKHFCSDCGEKVKEEQDFCIKYGNKLSNKMDLTKGKEAFSKLTKATVQGTSTIAEAATKKTGKKIKPAWVVGAVAAIVVIAVAVFMMIPQGLSGTYSNTSSGLLDNATTTFTFSGNNFKEVVNTSGLTNSSTSVNGTYKIDNNEISITANGKTETGSVSSDKKSFAIGGMTFTKK